MRALGRTGRDCAHEPDGPREYSTAWVPTADVFAGPDALVIRIELQDRSSGPAQRRLG